MTEPLPPPPRKSPLKRTPVPLVPSGLRSRAALGLAVAAAEGRFALQQCADCGAVSWPPRDACAGCLSGRLVWRDTDPMGTVLAQTVIRATPDPYWRGQGDWRVGTVRMDAGPSVMAHLHGEVAGGDRVRMTARIDAAGQGVMMAMPTDPGPHSAEDPQLRSLTAHPRHRRVLVTDARAPEAPALARALREAGAAEVLAGEAQAWRPNPNRAALEAAGAQLVPLDPADAVSVRAAAATLGDRVEIVVHNARFTRPGSLAAGTDTVFAAEAMQAMPLGLMRLAQGFGPALMARSADGPRSAVAWVNLLPVEALVPRAGLAAHSAAAAASLSVSRSLRAELRAAGIRVMNVFHGPLDDDWNRALPPPKLVPAALARGVLGALTGGLEDVFVGDIARDIAARLARDPDVLMREATGGGAVL